MDGTVWISAKPKKSLNGFWGAFQHLDVQGRGCNTSIFGRIDMGCCYGDIVN